MRARGARRLNAAQKGTVVRKVRVSWVQVPRALDSESQGVGPGNGHFLQVVRLLSAHVETFQGTTEWILHKASL